MVPAAEQSPTGVSQVWKRGSVTLVLVWSKKAQSVCVWTRVQDLEGRKPQKRALKSQGAPGIPLSFHPPIHPLQMNLLRQAPPPRSKIPMICASPPASSLSYLVLPLLEALPQMPQGLLPHLLPYTKVTFLGLGGLSQGLCFTFSSRGRLCNSP